MLRLCRLVGNRALDAGDSDRDHSSAHGRDVQASRRCPYPARIDRARHALLRGGWKRRLHLGVLRQISTPNSAALPHRPPRQEGFRNLPGPNERQALCDVPSTSLRILGRSVARGSVSHTPRVGRALLLLGPNKRHLGLARLRRNLDSGREPRVRPGVRPPLGKPRGRAEIATFYRRGPVADSDKPESIGSYWPTPVLWYDAKCQTAGH